MSGVQKAPLYFYARRTGGEENKMKKFKKNVSFWAVMLIDIIITLALFGAGMAAIFLGMLIWFQMSMPDWVAFAIQSAGLALLCIAEERPLFSAKLAERRAEKARKARIARRNRRRAIEAKKRREEEKSDSLID